MGNRLGQFRTILPFATFDFGKLGDQPPVPAVEVIHHRVALGVHAEAVEALLGGADPIIGDEFSSHLDYNTRQDGYCQILKRAFGDLTDPRILPFSGFDLIGVACSLSKD